MRSPTQRVPELDGIRGLAIVLVLVWHYFVSALRVPPATPLAYIQKAMWLSWSGVDLFFVLSGFLIGGILMDNRHAQNYFSVFYLRRTCRIFPLYFSALALFWVCRAFALPALAWVFDKPLPWWSYATYTQNIVGSIRSDWGAMGLGITWSLAVGTEPLLNSLTAAAVTCVSLAVTLLAAELSWRFFEKRFVDLGHRRKYFTRSA